MNRRNPGNTNKKCALRTDPVTSNSGTFGGGATLFLALLILILPFVSLLSGRNWLLDPDYDFSLRRLFLFLWAALMIAGMVLTWARRRQVTWRVHRLDIPVGLFALGLLVSVLKSPYPNVAIWGPLWHQNGLAFLGSGLLLYLGKWRMRNVQTME